MLFNIQTTLAAALLLSTAALAQQPVEPGTGLTAGEKYAARKAARETHEAAARAAQPGKPKRSPDFMDGLEAFGQAAASDAVIVGKFAGSVGVDALKVGTSVGAIVYTEATIAGEAVATWATSAIPKGAHAATSLGAEAWAEGTQLGEAGYAKATSLAAAPTSKRGMETDEDHIMELVESSGANIMRMPLVRAAVGVAILALSLY
ncbi:hypothetical protein P7C70_g2868, partial [Phenoliferia sp. Uapishka_3]